MLNAMIIDKKDNVAVAIEPVKAGDQVSWVCAGEVKSVTAAEDIMIYHKLAIHDIQPGEPVVKYGEHIGAATVFIPQGAHVHTHNVESIMEDRKALE